MNKESCNYCIKFQNESFELHQLLKSKSLFYKDALLYFAKNSSLCSFYFKDSSKVRNILKKYDKIDNEVFLEQNDKSFKNDVENPKKNIIENKDNGKTQRGISNVEFD